MLNLQAAIKVIEDFSLVDAGWVALQGILIVFSVLVILMIVLYIMKLFAKEEAPKATNTASVAPSAAQNVAAPVNTDETIAAICAAVGAMSGDDPTKRMRVVSIADQNGNYVWKK